MHSTLQTDVQLILLHTLFLRLIFRVKVHLKVRWKVRALIYLLYLLLSLFMEIYVRIFECDQTFEFQSPKLKTTNRLKKPSVSCDISVNDFFRRLITVITDFFLKIISRETSLEWIHIRY